MEKDKDTNLNLHFRDIDLNTNYKESIRDHLKKCSFKLSRKQLGQFVFRVAFRSLWLFHGNENKDKSTLDEFYYFLFKSFTISIGVLLFQRKQKIHDNNIFYAFNNFDHVASYYSYSSEVGARALDSSKAALSVISSNGKNTFRIETTLLAFIKSVKESRNKELKKNNRIFDEFNHDLELLFQGKDLLKLPLWQDNKNPPKLIDLDNRWFKYLIKPVMQGNLYSKEFIQFIQAYASIDEEVHKQQSAEFLIDTIEQIIQKATVQVNEARLIILGNGDAGKTSLVKCLHGDFTVLAKNQEPTPRVSVTTVNLDEINVSLWDFGGQVIMHSTHSFFVSSKSSYLVACNQRANEQPDMWLDIIASRIKENVVSSNVLVVYSHCSGEHKKAWLRENALKRKYHKQNITLTFKHIDMSANFKEQGFLESGIKKIITENAKREADSRELNSDINAIRELSNKLEKDSRPFVEFEELKNLLINKGLKETTIKVRIKAANDYGYIFPEQSFAEFDCQDMQDDFILINQRHWLTYGVYQVVNYENPTNPGILKTKDFRKALNNGADIYISASGEIQDSNSDNKCECINYDKEGIAVIKRVILNYRWGFQYDRRNDEVLVPLATSLDEPDDFADIFPYDENDFEKSSYFELRLNSQPKDFFFRLVTYFGSHLNDAKHLWRNGVVLHFYGSESCKALLEMADKMLEITLVGEDRDDFARLLLININQTIKAYPNLSVDLWERMNIGTEDKPNHEMLSSNMIDGLLNNTELVATLKQNILKRGVNNVTNITNNMHGDNYQINQGDNNKNYQKNIRIDKSVDDVIKLLKVMQQEASSSEKKELAVLQIQAMSIKQAETPVEKKRFYDAFMTYLNNFNAGVKASTTIGTHMPDLLMIAEGIKATLGF